MPCDGSSGLLVRAGITGAEPSELRALTGLRAIAAFAVLLYHLQPEVTYLFDFDMGTMVPGGIGILLLFLILNCGHLGVDLFFILSGFVISHRYGDSVRSFVGSPYRRFLCARLGRIYPVHLVTLLTMLGLVGLALTTGFPLPANGSFEANGFIDHLLLMAGWAVPIVKSWNILAWSISVEWAAYLAFPAIFALIRRVPLHWSSLVILLAANAALLTWFAADHPYDGNMSYGLLRLAGCFLIGCLLQRFFRAGLGRGIPWHRVSLVALLLLPTLALFTAYWGGQSFATAPILLALVIYGLAQDDGRGLGRVLATPIMRYGGQISYSFYMVQGVSLAIAGSVIAHFALAPMAPLAAGILILTITGATLLLALLLYHTVEIPGREAMRRWHASPRPSERSGAPFG